MMGVIVLGQDSQVLGFFRPNDFYKRISAYFPFLFKVAFKRDKLSCIHSNPSTLEERMT